MLCKDVKGDGLKITFSRHFIERNTLRGIGKDVAEKIFSEADGHYLDSQTNTFVAVKRMVFKGKERDVGLVYRKAQDEIVFITIHPLKDGQKKNRINSGRWENL